MDALTFTLKDQLSLYTFDEFKAFLRQFGGMKEVAKAIEQLTPAEFQKLLRQDGKYVALKMSDLKTLKKVVQWKDLTDLKTKQFTLKHLQSKKVTLNPVVRYLCDWQESKSQF